MIKNEYTTVTGHINRVRRTVYMEYNFSLGKHQSSPDRPDNTIVLLGFKRIL